MENSTGRRSPHPVRGRGRPSPATPTTAAPGRGWRSQTPPTLPRTRLTGVKVAARGLRARSTKSEQLLWEALRGNRFHSLKFRRQHPMDRYVLDFYCPERRLAVEVDGSIHELQEGEDKERQSILESMGIRFVRISAALVESNIAVALEKIRAASTPLSPQRERGRAKRGGEGF